MADLRAYARQTAKRAGVDQDIFERQIDQESGFNPKAFNAASGASGIAQIVPKWHPGVDVWNPEESLTYAAKLMAGYLLKNNQSYRKALASFNWGPGNVGGYTHEGVTVPPWDGRRETLPAETRHYLDVILGEGWPEPAATTDVPRATKAVAFDPTTPAELQVQDWTCAIRSTMWLLKSIGIDVTPGEAQAAMSPRYVTPDDGLLNADGSGIVAVLRERWGVAAENHPSVTFDDVKRWAGRMPVAIGGRNWGGPGEGHWSAVRGYDGARDVLLLANPATGAKFGQETLNREQWAWRGPWSAVAVPLTAAQPAYARPGDVGEGLLAWCAELGTEPAAPSTFLPLGRSPAIIEELVCMDGSVLRWHLPSGKRWRYTAA